jgi:SAM-dependent methyltransferase
MTVFGNYARYYDILYKDKDYSGEVEYINGLIKEYTPLARTVLDLGSGTGRHAGLLAGSGYQVHGVERSADMLAFARSRSGGGNPSFSEGDVRSVRLGKTFDVVLMLFHVINYQLADTDLSDAFSTAAAHCRCGGLFVFDTWYGPAVLASPPEEREKRVEDGQLEIVRKARPVCRSDRNIVEVHYDMSVGDREKGMSESLTEVHHMRYLFEDEIRGFLRAARFDECGFFGWMTRQPPDTATWSACFAARKIS